jgi:hypothetical protein
MYANSPAYYLTTISEDGVFVKPEPFAGCCLGKKCPQLPQVMLQHNVHAAYRNWETQVIYKLG